MVASKRCKICTVLDPNNVPILGEYFGRVLPDIILKISGVQLDTRKASGVLICQSCIIQLVHMDAVIGKIHTAVIRLQKAVKTPKLKTPSKNSSTAAAKEEDATENREQQHDEICKSDHQLHTDKAKGQSKQKSMSLKQDVKCNTEGKSTSNIESNIQNIEENNSLNNTTFKKFKDDISHINSTLAKPSKRKPKQPVNGTAGNVLCDKTESVDTTPVKRNKTMAVSLREEAEVSTADEQMSSVTNNEMSTIGIKTKEINCIICGAIFQSKSSLRDHIDSAHTGERLKACPHCSTEFRSQQKYESHVFSEKCKNASYACQYPTCNKRFKTLHKMELHMYDKHSLPNELGSKLTERS